MSSSRVGPFFVPVPCSRSISRPTRRSEIALRAAWARPREVFYFAGYFAGKPASEGPPSFGGFDSIFGCLLDGYYSIHYFMFPPTPPPPPSPPSLPHSITCYLFIQLIFSYYVYSSPVDQYI